MVTIAGLLIGLAAGIVQFLLLSCFSRGITGGKPSPRTVIFGIVQFFIPVAVLICIALAIPGDLIWAGGGLVAALFGGAAINAVLERKKRGGEKTSGEDRSGEDRGGEDRGGGRE